METKEEDFVEHLFIASTHSYILFFTTRGRCYWLKVHEIPQAGRTSRGKAVVNLIQLKSDEKIRSFVPVKSFTDSYSLKSFIMFATKNGTINKQPLPAFSNPRRDGINAIKVDDGDEIVDASLTDGTADIVLGTRMGLAVRFHEAAIRELGRNTRGVRGIKLGRDDAVISMVVIKRDVTLLTVTEKGYGKRTQIAEYRVTNRGGKGIINLKITDKNGPVVSLCAIDEQNEIMIISRNGIIIRISAGDIANIGRATQGVHLINLGEDDKVIDVSKVVVESDDDKIPISEVVGEGPGEGKENGEKNNGEAEEAKVKDEQEEIEDGEEELDDDEDIEDEEIEGGGEEEDKENGK
jgi:DNA gyrase subunit A